MKKNLIYALTLTLAGTLSLMAYAQTPMTIKKQARVQLPCSITKGGDVQSRVKVENTSNYAIPAGTKINVQIAGAWLPNLLQTTLPKGAARDLYGPADHGGGCKAQATVVVLN